MMPPLELLHSGGRLALFLLGDLIAEPATVRNFHAAFLVDSKALGGDDVGFFENVFCASDAAFDDFGACSLAAIFKDLLEEFIDGVPGVGVFELDFLTGNLAVDDA